MNKKITSEGVMRELTPAVRKHLELAPREAETRKDEILAEGRIHKHAWEAMRRDANRTLAALKLPRQQTPCVIST